MRLGFLASHQGTNMQAVLDACRSGALAMEPAVLICNNRQAEAVARAEQHGVPVYVLNAMTHPADDVPDHAMLDALQMHRCDLVVLAGYMKRIGPRVLQAFAGRILNIHPALLPKYGGRGMYGRHVHEAVLAAGEQTTGVSIHLVNEAYDEGRILTQCEVPVRPGDSVESLAARVLTREHTFLVETLEAIAKGQIALGG